MNKLQWRIAPLPEAAYWCDSSDSPRDTCWDSPQESRGLFYSTGFIGDDEHDYWAAGWFCYNCLTKIFELNNGKPPSDLELEEMMQHSLRERLGYEESN